MDFDRQKSGTPVWIRVLLFGFVVGALGWSATSLLTRFSRALPRLDRRTVVIDSVRRGNMVHEIRGIGQLVSEKVNWVSAESAGRIVETAILPGVMVDPDTLILKMLNPDLELSVTEASSEVQMAIADLRTERARLDNLSLNMKSELARLKGELDQARATYEITSLLFEQNAMPEHEVKLNKIKLGSLEHRFQVHTQAHEGFRKSLTDQLAVFEERLKQAKAKLRREERKLESLVIRAEQSGVLAQLPVEVGQQVSIGDVLAKIVHPKQLKAVIRIPEVQSIYVTTGQPTRIDTHHGIVKGRVSRIDPEVKDGSVAVDVTLDVEVPDEVRPDLSVVGMIEVARLTDVLFVGRPADTTANETTDVYRFDKESNCVVRTPVKIGVASINQIEIKDGLQENDELILSDMARFSKADRVRLE